MSVPKKRTTKSRRDKRRQHIFLKKPALTACQKCGKKIPPHTVCTHCGFYKGKVVLNVMEDLDKKEKKKIEKEMKSQEEESPKKGVLDWKKLSKK